MNKSEYPYYILKLKLKIDEQQGIIADMTAYLKDLCLGYPNSSFLYIEAQKLITKAAKL